jgi:cytochrome c553
VPDSTASFTLAQVANFYNPPDWHPTDHPAMPDIVAHGRTPDVRACGYCHLPNGQGRPENASLAGLSVGYIVQQLEDFKGGTRKSSVPDRRPGVAMVGIAAQATEKEVVAAAKYFSSLKPKQWIRVVETATVPKTRVSGWMLVPAATHGTEPIGQRIIEVPESVERTELRDDQSGFVAYVPLGSIKKGKALAESGGGGKTLQCSICHGPELKGMGKTPALAGRSPSYMVRQLYDMQSGARNGPAAQSMKPVVEKLSLDDMVSLAAYTASLNP